VIFINSIILKVADVFASPDISNKLRAHIVKELIAKCYKILEMHVLNKQEFTTRSSYPLRSNDP
jgi:2,3-bisphosphoglycerate-independent phosphoglycerate mutase